MKDNQAQRCADWRSANPKRVTEYFTEYRVKNREKRNAYNRDYQKRRYAAMTDEQREEYRAKQRARYWANKGRYRKAQRAGKYGLTVEQVDSLPTSCAVCGDTEQLHIDHNHSSGEVRGVLCRSCNLTLGQAMESAERLRGLADYLERTQKEKAA